MPELVGILLPPGPAVVGALRRVWDRGDAAVVLDPRLPPPALAAAIGAAAPSRLLDEDGERSRPDGRPVEPGDALVVLTSGTTSAPRAVVHHHDGVRAAATATSARLGVDPASDRWLACLPLAHVGGLGVVTRSVLCDVPLTVLDRPDPAAIDEAAARGATLTALVPTLLPRVRADRFRHVLVGGAAPPADLPPSAVVTWGMTETYGGVVYDGRPLDGVAVRADGDELCVRTPSLAARWRDGGAVVGPDGWFRTGDAGRVEADGTVTVLGRLDDVITTGGEKVAPSEVEARLVQHPGIAEVAVVGTADPEWGQRVVAVVVPVDPSAPPSLEELRDHVGAVLPRWCAPKEVRLLAELPRGPGGKVRRAALRQRAPDDAER